MPKTPWHARRCNTRRNKTFLGRNLLTRARIVHTQTCTDMHKGGRAGHAHLPRDVIQGLSDVASAHEQAPNIVDQRTRGHLSLVHHKQLRLQNIPNRSIHTNAGTPTLRNNCISSSRYNDRGYANISFNEAYVCTSVYSHQAHFLKPISSTTSEHFQMLSHRAPWLFGSSLRPPMMSDSEK
jgi:hypothetical protein